MSPSREEPAAQKRPTFVEKICTSYFGDFLVARGFITNEQLQEGLRAQQEEFPNLRIGEILVQQRALAPEYLVAALKEQNIQMRIGEYLIDQGVIGFLQLLEALDLQRKSARPLGKILLEMGCCTEDDIQEALSSQKRHGKNISGK